MAAPISYRVGAFMKELVDPTGINHMMHLGDSMGTFHSTNRMPQGYREGFPIKWIGYFQETFSSTIWGYFAAQGGPVTNVDVKPLAPQYGAGGNVATVLVDVVGYPPQYWREMIWSSNPTNCCEIATAPGSFIVMAGRETWLFSDTSTIRARFVYVDHTRMIGSLNLRGRRGGSVQNTTVINKTGDGRIKFADVTINAYSSGDPASVYPNAFVTVNSGFAATTADALVPLGVLFTANEATGTYLTAMSFGGFTSGDHVGTTAWSNLGLQDYFTAIGAPTHIILWVGQNTCTGANGGLDESGPANQLSNGNKAPYTTNVTSIIARIDAACLAIGAPLPIYLLVTQYKTGYNTTYSATQAEALYDISVVNPRVSFLDLYRLMGGDALNTSYGYIWTNGPNDGGGDDFHTNANGCRLLAQTMYREGVTALAETGDLFFPGDATMRAQSGVNYLVGPGEEQIFPAGDNPAPSVSSIVIRNRDDSGADIIVRVPELHGTTPGAGARLPPNSERPFRVKNGRLTQVFVTGDGASIDWFPDAVTDSNG